VRPGRVRATSVDLLHKDREGVERFEAEASGLDEVLEVRRTFGLPDYVVRVGTHDLDAFETFVTARLAPLPGSPGSTRT
jgi:DNA-binding Lrp family transcriptional regulator